MKTCQFIRTNKIQCKAKAIGDDNYCFWHSDKSKSKRQEAVVKGGKSLKRHYGRKDEISIVKSSDLLTLIVQTINDLRQTKTSTKIATTLGYLSGIALKIIEKDNIEQRLEVIEHVLQLKKKDE